MHMKNIIFVLMLLPIASCTKNSTSQTNKVMAQENLKLSEEEKQIIATFQKRRKIFNTYIKKHNLTKLMTTCPSCGYATLEAKGNYEICPICDWEDDLQDDKDADEIWGGPNGDLSLTANRLLIGKELLKLADSLNGQICDDPDTFIKILESHNERMEEVSKKIKGDTKFGDQLWIEWEKTKKIIKQELIIK